MSIRLCPLLDRIDLHIEVAPVKFNDLAENVGCESSKQIKQRVNNARRIQMERYKMDGIYFNSQLKPKHINIYCNVGNKEKQLLKHAFEKYNLSARAYNRILKVARTIADLEGTNHINVSHIAEALQHRCLDRKYTI